MTFTPNKNIETPAHNADINTWDINANANFTLIDTCFSGTLNLNATGLSGAQALTQANIQPPTIQISGAPTAAITYEFPSGIGGVWTVQNLTTGGFTVSVVSLAGGATIAIPANMQLEVWTDGTASGMQLGNSVFDSSGVHFPDGTVQATANAGMRLFSAQTPSGVAFIDFTSVPASVANMELYFSLTPNTLSTLLYMQFYNSVGVLDTGANYLFSVVAYNPAGVAGGGAGTASFNLSNFLGTNGPAAGTVWVNNVQGVTFTGTNWVLSAIGPDNATFNGVSGGGRRNVNGPITGLRIGISAGTISGQASLYVGP